MKTWTALTAMAILFAALFVSGCIGPANQAQLPNVPSPEIMAGNDSDAHGCIGSAGYAWCGVSQKCIRPWEENCTAALPLAAAQPLLILTESFPPFSFKGPDGAITGQSTEIVQEIMKRTGQKGQIELMGWPDAYALATKGPNMMLYSTDRKPERDQFFKWAGPIGGWEYDFYARSDSAPYPTLASAKKAGRICVVENDSRQQFLQEAGFANMQAVSEDASCASLLAGGAVDLWFGSNTSFSYVAANAGLSPSLFKAVLPVNRNDIYLAFSKDVPDGTVAAWQKALDAMKADGTFESIASKYESGTGFLAGNDSDAHGCIGSAGYSWCGSKQKCLRIWEESCPATTIEAKAQGYCGKENVAKVYVCGDYVKVVSSLDGAGSTFYANSGGNPIICPVVSPEYMPPDCGELLRGNYCTDREIC